MKPAPAPKPKAASVVPPKKKKKVKAEKEDEDADGDDDEEVEESEPLKRIPPKKRQGGEEPTPKEKAKSSKAKKWEAFDMLLILDPHFDFPGEA